MATWPSIVAPSLPIDEEEYFPQLRTEFESGSVQSVPAFTVSRKKWALTWSKMPESQYQTLNAFFLANQGLTWTWTHPTTGTAYTCRFSDHSLKSSLIRVGLRQVSVNIEEA